ncbi:hypothetical protein RFI_29815 [Reticulomyxa filosa]|uniref:Uncharacterized protein n=1 Tax=Reticulomyxa filosa TaxID=46433 RepID=X6M2D3_RETFI|nr:hypothetical protein RFI_29815 [Reticulomyxa filosa]|eukprot:ETO07577.1 hypothetical protein RFI_29815 [Reticulomyxa filosa]
MYKKKNLAHFIIIFNLLQNLKLAVIERLFGLINWKIYLKQLKRSLEYYKEITNLLFNHFWDSGTISQDAKTVIQNDLIAEQVIGKTQLKAYRRIKYIGKLSYQKQMKQNKRKSVEIKPQDRVPFKRPRPQDDENELEKTNKKQRIQILQKEDNQELKIEEIKEKELNDENIWKENKKVRKITFAEQALHSIACSILEYSY